MRTLWEKRFPRVAGGVSVSIESAETRRPMGRRARYLFVLLLRGLEPPKAVDADHVGIMHRGRLPVGVAAYLGGRMRQRWWA